MGYRMAKWPFSRKAEMFIAVGFELIALGASVLIGDIAAYVIAAIGVAFFFPAAKELIVNRSANAYHQIGIHHDDGKPYMQSNNSPQKLGPFLIQGKLYTYRVGVANRGDSTINDVEVKLTSIKECPPTFNATGGHLHWMHDNGDPPSLLRKSIPPTKQPDFSDAVFVDVLRCFWPEKPEERKHKQLQICHIVPGVPVVIPFRSYDLIVTANDQQRETVATTLRIEQQDDGPPKLTMGT